MRALLSVSDKEGIVEFARGLIQLGFEIISTGGTLKTLRENALEVIEVAEYTGFPEIFDGRVKTLHPKIHGGILQRDSDKEMADTLGIQSIDLVCVNLYPFAKTISKTKDFDIIIENIDIGGPSLIRAAAKNFSRVAVVTDKEDYARVLEVLCEGGNTLHFRQELMVKAFAHTAHYDCLIANYMNECFNGGFGREFFLTGHLVEQTKYGENPHQKGALYEFGDFYSQSFKKVKGEYSFNNLSDVDNAVKIVQSFGDKACVCIVKHGNPCGFAIKPTLLEAYSAALVCDPISAYGGVVAINGVLDKALAQQIHKTFLEVIVAVEITEEAQSVFADKKRTKLFAIPSKKGILELPSDLYDFRHISGGFLLQQTDYVAKDEVENAQCMGDSRATPTQIQDLQVAYQLAALTKSNGVVYVKNQVMVAVGMGMTSRVDASRAAISKANALGIDLSGSVLASEAFFPFKDSVEEAHRVGVSAIIQPGGSIRDNEVIECANACGIALYFTGKRHFLH